MLHLKFGKNFNSKAYLHHSVIRLWFSQKILFSDYSSDTRSRQIRSNKKIQIFFITKNLLFRMFVISTQHQILIFQHSFCDLNGKIIWQIIHCDPLSLTLFIYHTVNPQYTYYCFCGDVDGFSGSKQMHVIFFK